MSESFEQLLKQKRVFKLILGASNENLVDIENIVAIYAKAGCKIFDVGVNPDVICAAKRGIGFSIPEKHRNDYHICVSVGTQNDPHMQKCEIDEDLCKGCGACVAICPSSAIFQNNSKSKIDEKSCVGCLRCQKICLHRAITHYTIDKDLSIVLPEIIDLGIDCLEFHVNLDDKDDFEKKWQQINKVYNGFLSICITRGTESDTNILRFLEYILKDREPFSTIIQADGASMSGGKDNFKSNLQTLAFVDMLEKENLPAYIFASGGVNTKFVQAANQFEIGLTGIAIGSFARNAIKEHIKRHDVLLNTKVFNEAVNIAKSIVNSSLGLKY